MSRLIALIFVLLAIGCSGAAPPKPTFGGVVGTLVPDAVQALPPHVTLHMDTTFTPSERSVMNRAAAVWKAQTGGLAVITLLYDYDFESTIDIQYHVDAKHHMVTRLEDGMVAVALMDESSPAPVLGWMAPVGGIHNPWHKPVYGAFVVDRMGTGNRALQVAIHEFGHVLGIQHIPAVQAIMYPAILEARTPCLKQADIVAFCTVNACGQTQMFPCE